ncbi:Ig-like domain-containing protein, partial [Chromohalobacter sarecensis]
ATVTIAADGSFSYSGVDLSALADGELTATLTVEDAAGNAAPFTDSVTLDTAAPDAPTIDPTNGDDITGTAEVGSTVTLTDADGDVVGEPVTVGDDGIWSVTPDTPLANGDEVTVTATDPAGNASEPATETVDGIPPAEGDNSVIFGDDVYNAAEADSATLSGTVEDDATIDSLTITSAGGGDPLTIAGEDITLNGDGTFSYTADLSGLTDGELTATLTVTDAAGNEGTVTDTATLDTLADAAPTAMLTSDDADGLINADEADTASYTVSGLDPDATVVASFTDGTTTVTADVAVDGTFEVDLSGLADGEITSSLAITDAAGNTATISGDTLTLDTVAPDAPTIDPTNGETLTGTAEAGGTVTLTDGNGDVIGEPVLVGDDGIWSVTPDTPLADGDEVTATATDPAGNASDPATETVDGIPPAEGDNSVTIVSGDDAFLNADEAGNVTLTGQIEDGASIASLVISDGDGGSVTVDPATVTIAADGSFSYSGVDLSALADGELTATLTVEDAAGNAAPFTDSVTLDTAAPEA